MNYSSLSTTSFTALGGKIIAGMRLLMKTGESVRLTNRKGENWLLITLDRHRDRGYSFRFITADGQDVGDIILKASVKYWTDEDHMAFWAIHGAAWELKEHPFVARARERKDGMIAVRHGATHMVYFWGGRTAYGFYKRNWYGRKVLHLMGGKVNPEVLPTIRMVVEILK